LCRLAIEFTGNIICPLLNSAKLRNTLRHKSGTEIACHLLGPKEVSVAMGGNNTKKIKKICIKLLGLMTKRQTRHVKRDVGARSCNQFCSGREINIIYSEFVFVALGIDHDHAHAQHYVVICSPSSSTYIFSHIIS
jgi:hypothetical protein